MKPAVVLLSGGLDSATTLAIAQAQGFEPHALSFDYGQRHRHELDAADAICRGRAITHHVQARIDLRAFGGSALTSDEHEVPKDRGQYEMNHGIPITYVPARNTVFLSFALAWAETLHAFDIFIGVNAVDYSGYPDCRPEFLHAFERLANLGTKVGVEGAGKFTIHAPLMHLHKYEIIQRGLELGVDYSLTRSCYDPDSQGRACGHCDACLLRLEGFKLAGTKDPAPYVPAIDEQH